MRANAVLQMWTRSAGGEREPRGVTGLRACVMITVARLLPTQCEHNAPCSFPLPQSTVSVTLWYVVCASKTRGGVAGAGGLGSSLLTELTETGGNEKSAALIPGHSVVWPRLKPCHSRGFLARHWLLLGPGLSRPPSPFPPFSTFPHSLKSLEASSRSPSLSLPGIPSLPWTPVHGSCHVSPVGTQSQSVCLSFMWLYVDPMVLLLGQVLSLCFLLCPGPVPWPWMPEFCM